MYIRKQLLVKLCGIFLLFALFSCFSDEKYQPKVQLGIDCLTKNPPEELLGKRIGLITNPTGISNNLQSTIDILHNDRRFRLTALFGPEHGVRGDVEDGKKIDDIIDPKTGIPAYSLYGKTRKPTPEMLKDVDVLVFDIQDIGIRPYTYIYTMAYAMEAAKEHNMPFFVLDRPNPMGGLLVEGAVLDLKFKSGIGEYPIPYIHGMTVGELAKLFDEKFGIGCDLTVIEMNGWSRQMLFPETGLMWIPTSPHIPHFESCYFIAATGGIGELWSLSEGVGTPMPFEICGAPWIDGNQLANKMNSYDLPGVYFRPVHFKPFYRCFKGEFCGGIHIHILDFQKFNPIKVQIFLLTTIAELFPQYDLFSNEGRVNSFNKAMGTDKVKNSVQAGKSAEEIISSWEEELEKFKKIRQKYLLYE